MPRREIIAECTQPGWEVRLVRDDAGAWFVLESDLNDVDGIGDPYEHQYRRESYDDAAALFVRRVNAHLFEPQCSEIIQFPKAA